MSRLIIQKNIQEQIQLLETFKSNIETLTNSKTAELDNLSNNNFYSSEVKAALQDSLVRELNNLQTEATHIQDRIDELNERVSGLLDAELVKF